MTATRLVFIPGPDDAPPPRDDTRIVVLDTAWTRTPGERPDLVPVRSAVSAVLARSDLALESLGLLDAWAATAQLDHILVADGVAWWYRIRPFIWYALLELILWRRVIAEVAAEVPGGPVDTLASPACRPLLAAALVAAGAAMGARVEVPPGGTSMGSAPPGTSVAVMPATASVMPVHADLRTGSFAQDRPRPWLAGRVIRRLRRLARTAPTPAPPTRAAELRRRVAVLDARTSALAARSGSILVVAHPRHFQVVGHADNRLVDPQLAPVIDRLARHGQLSFTVALETDHRRDEDWVSIEADETVLPDSYLRARWGRPEDAEVDSSTVAELVAAIDVPLDVAGADLAPAVVAAIGRYSSGWLDAQRRLSARAERLIAELRPGALFLNHEGIRTPWLAAARRQGLPIVAVQHGVIYPTHPVYRHPRLDTIPLPDVTCVYGPYERESLMAHGGYVADEVVVTGSPRLDWSAADVQHPVARAEERRDVRRELGVADGDSLLVVSTAHVWIARDVYVVDMITRMMGGPMPGVHIVFKQHPAETDDGPYRMVLEGLAMAGRYAVPRITVVRDIDLYRLLRAADAHLGVSSTVLTDAVAAGTPNLIAWGQVNGDLLGYVAAAVAHPVRNHEELMAALAAPPMPTPEARAAFVARHFREGDASERIAAIVQAAAQGPG